MKLLSLNCPSCGAPIESIVNPNQPFVCKACNSTIVSTDWTTSGELICSGCRTVNAGKNTYCDSCNARLQAGCPFCYTQNSLSSRYCKQCGVDLRKAWKKQQAWLSEREQHEKERQTKLQEIKQDVHANLKRLLLQLDDPANHPMAIPGIVYFGVEAIEYLTALLKSKDIDARYGAARALGEIRDQSAVSALVETLNDEHPAVRFFALDALGKLKAAEAVQAIGDLLSDESPNVSKHAHDVLIQIGTPEAMKILREKNHPKWWLFGT
ncbi:MAG: HEAT repeat domain-containing protein [Anaerolineae bacterium]|nr:HEAT repeat domain-containing protein [Anaerolineae bacterium]